MKAKNTGFTFIELVIVIAIIAILAANALPRYMRAREEAHVASVKGTAGGLAAGVALVRGQWEVDGTPAPERIATNGGLPGFGDDRVLVNQNGYPSDYALLGGSDVGLTTDVESCTRLWQGVLQGSAPTVTGPNPDYIVAGSGNTCTFTYQRGELPFTIVYNEESGTVTSDAQ